MRVFLTGATGWIGSAVARELLAHGYEVIGLARSDRAASALSAAGLGVHRGDLDDLDSLRSGADGADGVIHLGFRHDFADFAGAGRTERAAVHALGDALSGTGRPLLLASGFGGLPASSGAVVETERHSGTGPESPRGGSEELALGFADRDVRAVALRFATSVHGHGDRGFVSSLVATARERGVSGYPGDGAGRWPAVHRDDAARMVRLAWEQAPAGAVAHAVGERGIPAWAIAEGIGRAVGVPVASVRPEDAAEHFGWLAMFFGRDLPASSAQTQRVLGWVPDGPTLLDDLAAGAYELVDAG